ncbi:unnamed protein product [Oikopleura dioica]|uniref:Aspartate dehydrogenase domain-containing protein n=1 Tax=Oikopleura dioica TaxID=34765 RepID=E4YDL3_OIKDI|nr:unnamed protein product [Oikopleura dioica]CBY34935.1 unnamed protein product [Oikopleura dioica]
MTCSPRKRTRTNSVYFSTLWITFRVDFAKLGDPVEATLALFGIGFDKTIGKLVSNSAAQEHTVTIEMKGTREGFCVKTERINPAPLGAVTGAQTFNSFLASLDNATVTRRTSSLQLC